MNLDWNRLEDLRAPNSLGKALKELGLYRVELIRRELRQEEERKWVTVPTWLRGTHPFMERVSQNEVGREIIRRTQTELLSEAERLQEQIIKENGLGLSEAMAPLVLSGELIGFIRVGGFVVGDQEPGDVVLEERFRVLMLEPEEMKQAIAEYRELPRFNADKQTIVLQMLTLLAREVIQFFEENLSAKEREEAVTRHTYNQIITSHLPLRQTLKRVPQIAQSDSVVLIYGEPGSGRELLARMIHESSRRGDREFRTLHCASIAENMLEAELLGYEKGAFAGAYADKKGLVEICEGGTLYLKEIGDLSLSMQLKLFKLIEDQVYAPLGAKDTKKANVRIVASTQRNLKRLVQMGTFREDLYFRLNVVEMEMPALRYRREDVTLLAEHFLKQFSAQMNKPGLHWKDEALDQLKLHMFPGNVRELKNEVERIVALKEAHSLIELSDLSSKIIDSLSPIEEIEKGRTLKDIVDEFEKKIVAEALSKYHWNKSRVAELFQITRQGLMKKIAKHKLDKRRQV